MSLLKRLGFSFLVGTVLTIFSRFLTGLPTTHFFIWPFGVLVLVLGSVVYGVVPFLLFTETWTWRTWARLAVSFLFSCAYFAVGLCALGLTEFAEHGKLTLSVDWPMLVFFICLFTGIIFSGVGKNWFKEPENPLSKNDAI